MASLVTINIVTNQLNNRDGAVRRPINCPIGGVYTMNALASLLWTIVVILFALWLIGFLLHVGGSLIHLILIVIGIIVIFNLITGRGARV